MWTDRRQNPQGNSPGRNSPVPNRGPGTPGPGPLPLRPGLNPRSSSLSLASSLSASPPTASLTGGLRAPNGSALRYEIRPDQSLEVSDPSQVLEEIVGAPLRKSTINGDGKVARDLKLPLESAGDIDFGGLSLQAFAHGHNDDKPSIGSNNGQRLAEYGKDKIKFEELHRSISACDQVLKSVETYLTGFQADLGAVSTEIESLQSRSAAMNTKLENRRVVEKLLGPAVEDIGLSPDVVMKITDGPIDEGWVQALAELEKRSTGINNRAKERKKMEALNDLIPLLENLTNRAIERIRDHIVAQIKALRSPNINAQIIQQQGFVNYRDLYTFLSKHQPQLAGEICQAYVNTMRWYYLNHFTRYETALKQIKLHTMDKQHLLGSVEDHNARRGRVSTSAHDPFSIGRRFDIATDPSADALSSYLAEEDRSTHNIESPFRSFNLALVDNASYEYTFLSNFFSPAQSFHQITRIFDSIFSPIFNLGQTLTKSLVENSTDAIGILLCVRLNQNFAFDLQRRRIPPAEGYINATTMLLWPRFQIVMDLHCDSLRKLSATAQSTAPHPVTQRFASFLQGLLALSSEAGDDEPVSNSLSRLRIDYETMITRLSKGIGDQRKRERFLYNNYSLVGTILEDATGRLAEENRRHFDALKKSYGDDL